MGTAGRQLACTRRDPGDLIIGISDEDSDIKDDEDTTSDKEAGSQEKEVDDSLLKGRMFRKRKASDDHLSPAHPKRTKSCRLQ